MKKIKQELTKLQTNVSKYLPYRGIYCINQLKLVNQFYSYILSGHKTKSIQVFDDMANETQLSLPYWITELPYKEK